MARHRYTRNQITHRLQVLIANIPPPAIPNGVRSSPFRCGDDHRQDSIMRSVGNEATERGVSAYYGATVQAFLSEDPVYITGRLVKAHGHDVELEQRRAWEEEIKILHTALQDIPGTIYLEFDVPRLASRIDAVLIVGPAILAIEFKVGEKQYRTAHYNQVWDYALDLKNFHLASHNASIFPLLVATEAAHSDPTWQDPDSDQVRPPRRCTSAGITPAVSGAIAVAKGLPLDAAEWAKSPYHPTPTIIEAARS